MAVTKTITIDVNTAQAVKGLKDLEHEVSNLIDETNELNETNLLFKKELAALEQQFNKIPKSALAARKAMGAEMDHLKDAIKDNNLALRDFRIKKQQKRKMIADLNTVHNKVLHSTEGFAKLGTVIGGAAVGMLKMAGASEKTTHALEGAIHGVETVEHVTEGATKAQKLYQKEIKGNSIATKVATFAQKAYAFAVGTGSKSMKIFRLALISTGIGALVVGLGLLIANFDKVKKAVTNAISNFDKLGPVMNVILFPITAIVEGFKLMKKGLVAFGIIASDEENQAEKRAAASKKRFDEENARIEKQKQNLEKRAKQEKAFTEVYLGELELRKRKAIQNGEDVQAIDDEILQGKIEGVEKEKKKFLEGRILELKRLDNKLSQFKKHSAAYNWQVNYNAEFRKQIANEEFDEVKLFNQQIEGLRLDDVDKDEDALNTKRDNYKQYLQDRLSIRRQIEDIENSLLEDGIEKELEINRDKFRKLREDAIANTKLTTEERASLIDLRNQQEAQAEEKIIADNQKRREDDFETERSERVELLSFVDELNTAEVESEKAKNLAILDDTVGTNEKLIESDKAVAEAKKNIQDAQIANVEAGISLLKDVAGENNKLQALAIAAENAVGIAKIIISTQAANAAATLKYAALPGGVALAAGQITANKINAGIGIAASVAAAAKGIASLKASASLDSGGNLGGGGAGTEAAVPQFNVVGDSGINQIAQIQQQPTQAYVVSGEVTTSQALDRNRIQNATL